MPKAIDPRPYAVRIGASGRFRKFLEDSPKAGRPTDTEALAVTIAEAVRIHAVRESRRAIRNTPSDPLKFPRIRRRSKLWATCLGPRPLP